MKISGAMLWRSRSFWSVLGVFLAANAWSFGRLARTAAPCLEYQSAGFPFPAYAFGPDLPGRVYVTGAMLDLATALTVAVTVVWFVRALRGAD
ncbi:MAG: hypothetical protein OEW35_16935 [Gammaproteobacteria bacterium]|nr:hypothetical protein [Gammaproteobacteria bacterium]MDH4255606.1 hypothetical protein [Gammaproteobacteria bacterium]MDH5310998.1 hypothetical protein [Gammaproteobacteria bacterium]